MNRALGALLLTALLPACASFSACSGAHPEPVKIDTRYDACSSCRMGISNLRVAAQIVAPSEEPRLFDDIGCLRDYLAGSSSIPPGAIAWVADHRTGDWVRAARAVYGRIGSPPTPMDTGLAAWADEASRSADPAATPQGSATITQVFGAGTVPDGAP